MLTGSGEYVTGANVENVSFPVGTCAERVAFGSAVVCPLHFSTILPSFEAEWLKLWIGVWSPRLQGCGCRIGYHPGGVSMWHVSTIVSLLLSLCLLSMPEFVPFSEPETCIIVDGSWFARHYHPTHSYPYYAWNKQVKQKRQLTNQVCANSPPPRSRSTCTTARAGISSRPWARYLSSYQRRYSLLLCTQHEWCKGWRVLLLFTLLQLLPNSFGPDDLSRWLDWLIAYWCSFRDWG